MKLAIDPGHGMSNRKPGVYDPGACAGGYAEAEIALQWALAGKHIANEFGIPVWLSRDDDSDPDPVGARDNRALAAGCTHFLSLHMNAGGGKGTEVFYRDGEDLAFGKVVLDAAVSAMGSFSRGMKTEGSSQHSRLAVLDFPGPAALLEIGFIDNANDRRRALDRDARIAFWRGLFERLRRG